MNKITAKIKIKPNIHQDGKFKIIYEIPAITSEPKTTVRNADFIVSLIYKAGVIFEKPYFLSNLKVWYKENGKDKNQFIIINKFINKTAFKIGLSIFIWLSKNSRPKLNQIIKIIKSKNELEIANFSLSIL